MKTKKHNLKVRRLKTRNGFTLLELVLIMTLLSMVSVGVYSTMTPQVVHVDSALLKVVHDIRFAQDRAMITGRNHGFRTITANQYEIYDTSPGNPTTDPSTQSAMTISLATNFPNVVFQTTYQLEFDSLGAPVTGGGTSVGLSNGTETKTFSLTNNTGLINLP